MIDVNGEYYNEFIEVELNNTNFRHYKNLGYEYPKVYDKYKHEFITPYGTKIMVKRKDLPDIFMIGKNFGTLTVIGFDYEKSSEKKGLQRYKYWICQCECGSKPKSIRQKDLLGKRITSCGCCFGGKSLISKPKINKKESEKQIPVYKNKDQIENLVGQQFGKLTVVGLDEETPQTPTKSGYFRVRWWCKCSCGNKELKSVLASHLKRGNIQSCGCLHKEATSGENNCNWKGGKTSEIRLLREREEYFEWRRKVLARDKFFCQCCRNSCSLNAHHLYNFVEFEDLRYNTDNGITLCEACHAARYDGSFHNLYGTHNNTPEQLREYILNKSNIDIFETHPKILSLTTQPNIKE